MGADGQATTSLPANTFSLGTEPIVAVRLWGDAQKSRPRGGVIFPNSANGVWTTESLVMEPSDAAATYVSGIDRAGNESIARPVQTSWYVASTRFRAVFPGDRHLCRPRGRAPRDPSSSDA